MPKYTDEQGNEIELPFTPEEIQKLPDTLKEREEELAKFRDKDMNFKNLKDKAKEDKEKAISDLRSEVDGLKTKTEQDRKTIRDETVDLAKSQLGLNEDKDLLQKVEFEMGQLNMPENTPREIMDKWNKAYRMATGASGGAGINPLNAPMFGSGFPGYTSQTTSKKEFGLSEDGKAIARKIGLNYVKRADKESSQQK